MHKTAFPPIVDNHSKVLILGTMPGEQSLKLQQYYGHKGNHFWKIICGLFGLPLIADYGERKQLLLDNHVALWDVLEGCYREGSADSKIRLETPNDFDLFFKQYPEIKTVFFASTGAKQYYEKYVARKPGYTYHKLPSPSGANTWKTFDQKVKEWKAVLGYL